MQFLIPFGEKISEWELPFVFSEGEFIRIPFEETFENGDRIISINLPEEYFLEVWNGVNFIGVEHFKNDTVTFSEETDYLEQIKNNFRKDV